MTASLAPVDNVALIETLKIAVPLWMAELNVMSAALRRRRIHSWAADAAEVVAYHGDTLIFRTQRYRLRAGQITAQSRRPAGTEVSTAETFNHLARGLAALAHCPGGVLFGGIHWCRQHPAGVHADSIDTLPCWHGDANPDEPLGSPVVDARVAEVYL